MNARPPNRATTAILTLCAAGAVAAALAAIPQVAAADPEAQGAEMWRLIGYLMFAGVFVVLARDPGQRDLWAVTIAAKAALPLVGLTLVRHADDAATFVVADGAVTALLVLAYVLSTRSRVAAPEPAVPA